MLDICHQLLFSFVSDLPPVYVVLVEDINLRHRHTKVMQKKLVHVSPLLFLFICNFSVSNVPSDLRVYLGSLLQSQISVDHNLYDKSAVMNLPLYVRKGEGGSYTQAECPLVCQ